MKHTVLLLLFALAAQMNLLHAQTGMHIAPFYDGRYNKDPHVVTLQVKGHALRDFKLTLYRSLTFDQQANVGDRIEQAVLKDAKQAIDRETGFQNGHLLYGFYGFEPAKNKGRTTGERRYLFYRRTQDQTYLVYMEGSASLDDLKKMFKK